MKKEKIKFEESYENIISVENLLEAWKEFQKGKKQKKDVQIFQMNLMNNIILLHEELLNYTYNHGGYQAFKINDPKPRDIHKATVRDRLLHHAIYRKLYPFFDRTFISDSYSCRNEKGTHKALKRFLYFSRIVSRNNTRTCWILKGDIKKFFASINQKVLKNILAKNIGDKDILQLLTKIINSFNSIGKIDVGLPLGNLTSQLLVNIYMNEFDQFVRHQLKIKYYIRYADDFVIFSENKKYLESMVLTIHKFLEEELRLELHPDKIFIKTLSSGMDFLGYVNFFDYRILRTKTKNRIFKKMTKKKEDLKNNLITVESFNQSLQSYLGVLKHCQGYKIVRKLPYEQ